MTVRALGDPLPDPDTFERTAMLRPPDLDWPELGTMDGATSRMIDAVVMRDSEVRSTLPPLPRGWQYRTTLELYEVPERDEDLVFAGSGYFRIRLRYIPYRLETFG